MPSLLRICVSPLLTGVFLASVAACAVAAPNEKPPLPDRIQVSWAPTEKLTEVKDNQIQRGNLKPDEWQKMISDHMRKRADATLPAGQRLEVTIDDIKLAGAYEPWRGPNAQDIRVMKDVYPPRMDLHYRLLAADGSTIRDGEGKLRDMAYLQRSMPITTDPLRYDKRMIDDWLRKEFGRPRD
jgi:hypothetical protein